MILGTRKGAPVIFIQLFLAQEGSTYLTELLNLNRPSRQSALKYLHLMSLDLQGAIFKSPIDL